jgi:regulator of chromosome condensation
MEVPFEVSIDQISAGDSHSMFLNSTNNLLFFCGAYRGINKGFLADKVRFPTLIPLESILIRRHIDSKIRKVVSGSNHTLVLIDDQVYIRGDVEYFASGRKILPRNKEKLDIGRFQNVGIKHIEDIWTGGMHCFVKAHGQIYYGWGNNAYGQLGIGNNQHQTFPVEIEFFEGMEIKQIAGGEHHSIFLTN